jgi:hypothetical protein
MKRSKMPASSFAIPSRKAYPIPDAAHARNALARVEQRGSAAEKRQVYSAVRRRFPALAERSAVVPTSKGSGRHYGQAKGTTNRGRR